MANTETPTYRVKFFDAQASKRGRGVQVAVFADRAEAESFAARNRIYAGPCKVEVVGAQAVAP
jgi:hypothetical protein